MPLVSLKEVLKNTQERRFAVGAFNVMDHSFAEGILLAAEETSTPVILAAGDFPGPDYANFIPYLLDRISRTSVPVCLHFDHGSSYESCARAIRAGFSSVMIDGSSLPFDENVSVTRRVAELAHACSVDVEGEIGHTASASDSMEGDEESGESIYTDPKDAVRFVEETGVDALAVAIGTVHGTYKREPKLDFPRLAAIRSRVQVPLVMHGSSGLSAPLFKEAIENGICKINAFTNLTLKVTSELATWMCEMPLERTMSHILSLKMTELAKKEVMRHIKLFGTEAV